MIYNYGYLILKIKYTSNSQILMVQIFKYFYLINVY
jgi:hypothetical protein